MRKRIVKGLQDTDIRPYDNTPMTCTTTLGLHLSWFNGLFRTIFKLLATAEGPALFAPVPLIDHTFAALCHIDKYHQELNQTRNSFFKHMQWGSRIFFDQKRYQLSWVLEENKERFASFLGQFPTCGPSKLSMCHLYNPLST